MTIAQSEDSCVVFGMPKAAIERGYATRVVGLEAMASTLLSHVPPTRARGRRCGHGQGGSRRGRKE